MEVTKERLMSVGIIFGILWFILSRPAPGLVTCMDGSENYVTDVVAECSTKGGVQKVDYNYDPWGGT